MTGTSLLRSLRNPAPNRLAPAFVLVLLMSTALAAPGAAQPARTSPLEQPTDGSGEPEQTREPSPQMNPTPREAPTEERQRPDVQAEFSTSSQTLPGGTEGTPVGVGQPEPAPPAPLPPVPAPPAVVAPSASAGGAPESAPPQATDTPMPAPALGADWSWVDTVGAIPPGQPPVTPARKLPFRGSGFTWGHRATTTILGIGADYVSPAYQVYEQSYTLLLNYFVYDTDAVDVRITTAPGFDVELTNSDVTTTYREPLFRDLPVSAILSLRMAEDKARLLRTSIGANLTLVAPTSKLSYSSGHYFTVSPRVGVSQLFPLLGADAPLFSDLELGGQVRFDHLFSRSTVAVNPDLNRSRRSALGIGTLSDVLNGSQIAPNSLRFELFATLTEELLGRPLTLLIGGDYTTAALYGIDATEVRTATGTTQVASDPRARVWRKQAGVGVELTYHPTDPLSIAVGYTNSADLDSSESSNFLYTPYAVFLAGVTVHLDALFQVLSGQEVAHPPEFDPSQAQREAASTW